MNKWIGSGKVSEDPIIKYDGDKASFIAFTIMVKRNRRIKEGRKIYTKTVYAEEISFAETKAEEEERQEKERRSQEPEPAPPDYNFMDIPDGIDGELPFC